MLRSLKMALAVSVATLGAALSAPAQTTCPVPSANGNFTAVMTTQNVCSPGLSCASQCMTLVSVIAVANNGCLGTSGNFLFCADSDTTLGFVACGSAHLLTPANGASWGIFDAGLPCTSWLNYVSIP